MMKMFFATCTLAALVAPAMGMAWSTDLDAAKQQAAAAGKCVLLHFTGSDWCGHCVRQHADVFSKPEFEQYVQKKLVPVEVDMPRSKPQSVELQRKNEQLCDEFSISGFPTILVLTPTGTVTGGYVGNAGTPANAIKQLDAALANAAKLKQAESLSGAERLKALAAVYSAIPAPLRDKAAGLRRQIIELDPADSTGLRAELRAEQQMTELLKQLQTATPRQAIQIIDTILPQAEPANKVPLVQMKMNALMLLAETEADVLKIADLGDTIANQEPRMLPMIQQLRAQPKAILEQIKRMRARQGGISR